MAQRWMSARVLLLLACLMGWGVSATAQTTLKCGGFAPMAISGTGWEVRPFNVYVGGSDQALVSGYNDFVTASIASGPGGAQISGTTTVQAVSTNVPGLGQRSVATFTNIVLTGIGTYTLRFTAPGLSSCTTNSLDVGPSFHLGANSPARGFGASQPGVVVTDFDGFAVPQGGAVDAGALQYRTPGTPPPPVDPPPDPGTCPPGTTGTPPNCVTEPPPPSAGPIPPPQNFRLAGAPAPPVAPGTPPPAFGAVQASTSNPRYMQNSAGEIVYLTGAYSWNFAKTMTGPELTTYLAYVAAHGYNLLRVPSEDYDGTAQSTSYFTTLAARIAQAAASNLYVQVVILPYTEPPFDTQVFNEAYARALVRAVGTNLNVLYEVGNELNTQTLDAGTVGAFVNQMVTVINNEQALQGFTPRRMVGITDFKADNTYNTNAATVSALLGGSADFVGIGYSQRTVYPCWVNPDYTGTKVSIPDTDHTSPYQCDHRWAWEIFTMGGNPTLLDGNDFFADHSVPDNPADTVGANRTYDARSRMGDTRTYALKLHLAQVVPHPELSSTGYALAWPGHEYLVYQPFSGAFTVTTVAGTYTVEWFNPTAHTTSMTTTTVGTGATSFTSPLNPADDAVLFLKLVGS